jgi:hypothetical protein
MAEHQLDRIEASLADMQAALDRMFAAVTKGTRIMALTVADFAVQIDAATTAEDTALAAQTAKLDAVQAELKSLADRLAANGVPQTVLDSLAGSLARLDDADRYRSRPPYVAPPSEAGVGRWAIELLTGVPEQVAELARIHASRDRMWKEWVASCGIPLEMPGGGRGLVSARRSHARRDPDHPTTAARDDVTTPT